MAGYLGSTPVPQATQHRESFTATSGQTTFATAGYTAGFVDVYLNGSHLSPADFVATNGSDVVLASGASADDVCDIISHSAFEVNAQTFTGTTTMDVVTATGVVTANAGVVVDNFTLDGTTLALSSGDFTVDVAGNIILNADGSTIVLADGSLTFGQLFNTNSGDFGIYSSVQDKDMIFIGNDGGSNVNALILDMSAGGAATFNSTVNAGAGLRFATDGSNNGVITTLGQDKDLFFAGDDGGAGINALVLDMSAGGAATFNTGFTTGSTGQAVFGNAVMMGTTTQLHSSFQTVGQTTGGAVNGITICSPSTNVACSQLIFQNPNGIVGSVSTSGSATAFNTSSDYRLKTDAQPMTGASDRVLALKPVNFKWIVDATRVDGFLAHEAQAVVPEAVTGTKDAMKDEEYQVSAATGDIYTAGSDAYVDEDGNDVDAVNEVIHSTNAEQPETLADGQQWRETTPVVMGTRSVPDMQGIDQSKLVPLLVASLQEALARITVLENA